VAHQPKDNGDTIRPHRFALLLFITILLTWGTFMVFAIRAANLSDETAGTVFAIFAPGTSGATALSTIIRAGGLPIRQNLGGMVWTAHGTAPGFAGRLRRQGAMAVLDEFPFSPQLGGCIVYAKSPRSPYSLRRNLP